MPDATRGAPGRVLDSLRRLSDDELVGRLKSLAARERRATALLVAHLAELDTRDVHMRAGYSSLFAYCRDVLALSEHEALNRIDVARTARRFPVVLDLLATGEVNLTTIRLLGPHLTAENHSGVLASALGKRKGEVEEIVARLSPRPDVAASVRRLPDRRSAPLLLDGVLPSAAPGGTAGLPAVSAMVPAAAPATAVGPASAQAVRRGLCPADEVQDLAANAGFREAAADLQGGSVSVPLPHGRRSAVVTPLSHERYRYQLTIGGSTLEKLRLAKDLLRHALPSGDDEVILDRALTALLTDLARKKFGGERACGTGKDPSANETASSLKAAAGCSGVEMSDSRRIPVAVKRAVWVRDLGRCAFVAPDGRRCGERAFVEFHHVRPYAAGGRPTVDNIQLRCRRHNGYEARAFFAREVDERQTRAGTGDLAPMSGTTSSRGRSGTSSVGFSGRSAGPGDGRLWPIESR